MECPKCGYFFRRVSKKDIGVASSDVPEEDTSQDERKDGPSQVGRQD